MAHNVSGLCEGRASEYKSSNLVQMIDRITNVQLTTEALPFAKPLLAEVPLSGVPISEVYLMDCVEGMKHYPDKYFDLACIDPPYGIGHSLLSGEKRGSKFVRTERHVDWDILPTNELSNNAMKLIRK